MERMQACSWTRRLSPALIALGIAATACSSSSSGGGSDGTTSLSGTLGGETPSSATVMFSTQNRGSGDDVLIITFTSTPNACSNRSADNSAELNVFLPAGSGPGTYSLTASGLMSSASYDIFSNGAADTWDYPLVNGTVTVTSTTADTVAGKLDLTFGQGKFTSNSGQTQAPKPGGEITGTFSATHCAAGDG